MAHDLTAGADVIVMDLKDQVATALSDLAAGQTIRYRLGDQMKELVMLDPVPFGHKVAIAPIAKGDRIFKYGEVIGAATSGIEPGKHVHVQNVEGIRGRGDQAKG